MKQKFQGYYTRRENIHIDWDRAIFVFDSEVILRWFILSNNYGNQIVDAIYNSNLKLWLPYIIANDYHARLHREIECEIRVHYDIINRFQELKNRVQQLDLTLFNKKSEEQNFKQLTEQAIRHELKVVANLRNYFKSDNEFSNKIANLFSGVVNAPTDDPHPIAIQSDLSDLDCTRVDFNNQLHRMESSQNDYINYERLLYKCLLEKSKEDNSPIVYIVNSRKSHYMYYNQNTYFGLHPRLLTHFIKHSGGNNLYCCEFKWFLHTINKKYQLSFGSELFKQVTNLSQNNVNKISVDMPESWFETPFSN